VVCFLVLTEAEERLMI